ncbi:hypothetical protein [Streptomyces sp. NPDC006784]|uniref:hypothetical protein n=1 Tax=Streptomyces sp. NPDC006784 TaxID=3364764 RepID=UPI0036795183
MATTRTPRTKKPADETGTTTEVPAVPDFATTSEPPEEKRRPLFSIDGEQFTVPEEIGPRIVYLGLDRVRSEGAVLATMYLNELVLGRDQYSRLMGHVEARRLTDAQFDQIGDMISDLFFKAVRGKKEEGKDETTDSDQAGATS